MVINIFNEIEKISDKFKDFLVNNDNPFVLLGIFGGIFIVFIIGWNFLHKND